MKSKKLSIVIPVYNVEEFLVNNIESLLHQTYMNLELIYVDDGSTDNSAAILDEYAAKDHRILIIHNSNHGVSYTRNCGINHATGDYITFVDGDDYVDSNYAEYLIGLIQHDDADIAISLNHHINDSKDQERNLFIKRYKSSDIIDSIYLNKIYMAVWNKIYSLDYINRLNIRFDESIWYAEGMHFNIQCLVHSDYIIAGNMKVYHYISNPNSAMRKGFNINNEKCALKSLDYQRDILRKNMYDTQCLEFHYMMVNFMILCGILENKFENIYSNEITECKDNLKLRKKIPLCIELNLKQKIKWFVIGCFPKQMARRDVSVHAHEK